MALGKLPAAIPVPKAAVVVVIDYESAEAMYEYILAHQELPPVFHVFSTALDHPQSHD